MGKEGLIARGLGLALAALAAGCAQQETLPPEPAPPPPAAAVPAPDPAELERQKDLAEVASLLAYYQGLLEMPAAELRREYNATNRDFSQNRSEAARLRLALLLCLPGASWQDDARLLALLDGSASRKAPTDSPRYQLVVLLQKLATQHLREKKRADDLQKKLDALVHIERSLQRRKPPAK
ncbi:MAG TPA: hypothetical protein PKC23_00265 [Candidatus Desulfobacillus sp.]|nr:hypothetical protein [Candidatus Desulfobacillus sp.]